MIRLDNPACVGDILSDLRAMHRLTQQELAAASGLPQSRMSEWETGKITPSVPTLIRLVRAHGYDLALIPREDA